MIAGTLFAPASLFADRLPALKLGDVLTKNRTQKLQLPAAELDRYSMAFEAGIVADLANRRMFVRDKDGLTVYRMGIGRPASQIPFGRTKITLKRNKPTWTPTPEARKRNPFLPKNMSALGANPLGSRALNLTWRYYLIHGTNDHEKIGRSATWGCMSLAEEDVAEVFSTAKKGQMVDVYKDVEFELGSLDRVGLPVVQVAIPSSKPAFITAMSEQNIAFKSAKTTSVKLASNTNDHQLTSSVD